MMYSRILSTDEILAIANNCTYPEDILLRPQTNAVKAHGKAEISVLNLCPDVNPGIFVIHS